MELSSLLRDPGSQCVVSDEVAFRRAVRRGQDDPVRQVHANHSPDRGPGEFVRQRRAFTRVAVAAPWIEVDTTVAARQRNGKGITGGRYDAAWNDDVPVSAERTRRGQGGSK